MQSRTKSIANIDAWRQLQNAVANAGTNIQTGLRNARDTMGTLFAKGSYSQTPVQQPIPPAATTPASTTGQFATAPPTQQVIGTAVEGKTGAPIAQCPAGMVPTADGMGCMYVTPMTQQQQTVFAPAPNTNANYQMGRKVLGSGCACGR